MTPKHLISFLAISYVGALACYSQAPIISFQNMNISGLSAPLDLVNAADGSNRMFIVQRTGMIKLWTGGTTTTNFINLGATGENHITTAGSEEGLLSLAFHPNFNGTTNRYFYVYYTDVSGNLALRRYQTMVGNQDVGDPNSDVLLLTIPHPTNGNHNGGKLNFGSDGYLYFATGDGGGSGDVPNNAQNGNSLLGKMLRIDVDNTSSFGDYAAPASNPYTSDPNIDDRIYALGLRNPFRWSFDRLNGNIWIGDVGQGAWEEVNFRTAANAASGTNYGWRCYEGAHPFNTTGCQPITSYTSPVFEYPNPGTGAAVTGGYVYRGNEYLNFRGYYVAADVYSGTLYLVWPNGSGWSSTSQAGVSSIVAFGESESGVLYAVSLAGAVYKLVATGGTPLPVKLQSFSIRHTTAFNDLEWTTGSEQNLQQFQVEYSVDAVNYKTAGIIKVSPGGQGNDYKFRHDYQTNSTTWYRLKMVEDDGNYSYSRVLKLVAGSAAGIYPNLIQDGFINVTSSKPLNKIQLFNSNGSMVYEKSMNGLRGSAIIQLPSLPTGVYIVQLVNGMEITREKIVLK